MASERDRSRSPRGMASDEIVRNVMMREQARLSKDWSLADSIRERLAAAGVTVFDKTNTWRSNDGLTGRIPTFTEIEAGQGAEGLIVQQEPSPPGFAGGASDGPEAHIKYLVQSREQARASKDWASSDRIRDELKALGVELFDKDKMWRAKSGMQGCIIGYRGTSGPTDLEISTLVLQRERSRQSSDFKTADMIRDELKAVGVDIRDKDKTWHCTDGRGGPVPNWTDISGGAGMGEAGRVVVAPLPASPYMGGPGQAAAVGNDLRNQVIQAALAAAQTPVAAARTLQLLQSAAAGGVAAYPSSVPAGRPTSRGVVAAPPPAARNPEAQEALDFISSCQASGQSAQDTEINWLVEIREKLRQSRDFTNADELRNAMRSTLGVELHEQEKQWVAKDGRQGAIPMWGSFTV